MDLGDLRNEYGVAELSEERAGEDPLALFTDWFASARRSEAEPSACTLATVGSDGRPAARIVLCKAVDERGFAFFTNLESRKGQELARHPFAALVFAWLVGERQVRVEGPVEAVDDGEADRYFASRPRTSRLGAWASPQSRALADREELEERFRQVETVHARGEVPRPPFWGGFRLVPTAIEFWQGRPSRLHDRLRFTRADAASAWRRQRLAP